MYVLHCCMYMHALNFLVNIITGNTGNQLCLGLLLVQGEVTIIDVSSGSFFDLVFIWGHTHAHTYTHRQYSSRHIYSVWGLLIQSQSKRHTMYIYIHVHVHVHVHVYNRPIYMYLNTHYFAVCHYSYM